MVNDSCELRQLARDRERLRCEVAKELRAAGRWDFTDAEIAAAIESRLAVLQERRAAARQLDLPLERDEGQTSRETRNDACRAMRKQRIGLQKRIRELLEVAGANGLLREELATALGVKDGHVSAPVKHLIDSGEACQPTKRLGSCGMPAAVVVLAKLVKEHAV